MGGAWLHEGYDLCQVCVDVPSLPFLLRGRVPLHVRYARWRMRWVEDQFAGGLALTMIVSDPQQTSRRYLPLSPHFFPASEETLLPDRE